MQNIKRNEDEQRIKKITRTIAGLFMLLSLYYIIWTFVKKDDFSSVIIYSLAIAACIMAIEQLILNKGTFFVVFFLLSIFLFLLGILKINIFSVFI